MIKVTVLYPRTAESHFDFDYYLNTHMPDSIARLGSAMERIEVERLVPLGPPWPEPEYHAICTFCCESRQVFEEAFFPHMESLQSDAPNYTDVEQIVLFSEIEISRDRDALNG